MHLRLAPPTVARVSYAKVARDRTTQQLPTFRHRRSVLGEPHGHQRSLTCERTTRRRVLDLLHLQVHVRRRAAGGQSEVVERAGLVVATSHAMVEVKFAGHGILPQDPRVVVRHPSGPRVDAPVRAVLSRQNGEDTCKDHGASPAVKLRAGADDVLLAPERDAILDLSPPRCSPEAEVVGSGFCPGSVQGAPPQALLLLPLRRQHQASLRGLENDWTATLRGAGHAESGHQPSKGSAQRAEPPGARGAKARARLLRGATRARGAGAARRVLAGRTPPGRGTWGGSCDAACLPEAAARPYLVATVYSLGVYP